MKIELPPAGEGTERFLPELAQLTGTKVKILEELCHLGEMGKRDPRGKWVSTLREVKRIPKERVKEIERALYAQRRPVGPWLR